MWILKLSHMMTNSVESTEKIPFEEYTSPRGQAYYEHKPSLENTDVMEKKERDKEGKTAQAKGRTREVISAWAYNVSCHGIPNIQRSHHVLRKVIWTLIFLTGAGVVIYQVREQIVTYYSYPVIISVNVTHTREMTFPAVTICNLNPARNSRIAEVSSYLADVWNHQKGHHAGRHQHIKLFQDRWARIPSGKREAIGHQKDDFIIDCSFNGNTCGPGNFTTIVNPIYGNCFTWNAGLSEVSLSKSTQTGPHFGLTLELDIEQWDYIPDITEAAGARLLVHPPDRMPFPQDEGYYLEPGQLNSIGIRTENITRLKSPFPSHCIDPPPDEALQYSVYSEWYDVKYTVPACLKTCLQKHMVSECNCSDPKVPNNGTAIRQKVANHVPIHPCNSTTEVRCEEDVRDRYRTGHLECDCPTACLDVSYIGSISQVVWPNEVYMSEYIKNLRDRNSSVGKLANSNSSVIHANLIKVEVFFEELNYVLIQEVRAYTWFSLLSDIGGLGGLYLGVSLVALFEFFELLLDLIARCCSVCCTKERTSPKS